MSFTEKRLCNPTQLNISGQTLYTVPASKTSIIKQIVVTNVTGSAVTFSLYIGSAATPNALFSATSVFANDTIIVNLSQVLNSLDTLTALASANNSLNITISGVENDGPLNPLSVYIADQAITTNKIADGSITTAKVADGSIVLTDLAASLQAYLVPVGTINAYAGTTAPTGWLFAFGQTVSRTTYPDLFTAIGTNHGSGDGSTTFGLPDMRGRVAAGKDDMGGSAASRITSGVAGINGTVLGQAGGSQSHTMTSVEMPSHTHTQNAHGHVVSANSFASDLQIVVGPIGADGNKYSFTDSGNDASSNTAVIYARDTTATNQSTGGGGAHNNTQPTIILNYIIKAL
jgi:microcystin-dependent protein